MYDVKYRCMQCGRGEGVEWVGIALRSRRKVNISPNAELLHAFRQVLCNVAALPSDPRSSVETHVDSDEFEHTILCED